MVGSGLLRWLLIAVAAICRLAVAFRPGSQRGLDPALETLLEVAAAAQSLAEAWRGSPPAAEDGLPPKRPHVPPCFTSPLKLEAGWNGEVGRFAYNTDRKALRMDMKPEKPMLPPKFNLSSYFTRLQLGSHSFQITGGDEPVCRDDDMQRGQFHDLFRWAANPLLSAFEGLTSVGDRPCALWCLRLPPKSGITIQLCADGDAPVQLSIQAGSGVGVRLTFGNLTAVGPKVDQRLFNKPAACGSAAPACANGRGVGPKAVDVYVYHPGMSAVDYDIADQDVADLVGDAYFICADVMDPQQSGKFIDHNYTRVSRYSLLVSPAFGQYGLCNGYPDTDPPGPLCFGGDSRLVGREAPFFAGEGELRCAMDSPIGFWYSLPRAGKCSPGQAPGPDSWQAGCTWAVQRRVKTIGKSCLLKQQRLPEKCLADFRKGRGSPLSAQALALAFASEDISAGGCPDIGGPDAWAEAAVIV